MKSKSLDKRAIPQSLVSLFENFGRNVIVRYRRTCVAEGGNAISEKKIVHTNGMASTRRV